LVAHRRLRAVTGAPRAVGALPGTLKAAGVFHLVCLAWVFFRAETFATATAVLGGILRWQPGEWDPAFWTVPVVVTLSFAMDLALRRVGDGRVLDRRSPVLQGAVLGALLVGVVVASGQPGEPFLYFQF